jgi:hypothetical protein
MISMSGSLVNPFRLFHIYITARQSGGTYK